MEVQVNHLDQHLAQLLVHIDQTTYQQAVEKTAKRLGKDLRVPGFRPGKAPTNVILSMINPQEIASEVLDDIGNDVYLAALEQSQLEPYSPAEITEIKLEAGLQITFQFPKVPEVELGNYRESLRQDYTDPEVLDEDVETALKDFRERMALSEEIETRPAQLNDRLSLDVRGIFKKTDSEDEESEHAHDHEHGDHDHDDEHDDHDHDHSHDPEVLVEEREVLHVLTEDADLDFMPGFSSQLVGMQSHEEKAFELTFPEDFHNTQLAGRTVEFTVYVNAVYERIFPEINDFMALVGSDGQVKTLDELRTKLHDELYREQVEESESVYFSVIMDSLVENAQVFFPEQMVENYIDDLLDEVEGNMKREHGPQFAMKDLLRQMGKIDEVRDQLRENAVQRIKYSSIFRKIATLESIQVTETDIAEEIKRRVEAVPAHLKSVFENALKQEDNRGELESQVFANLVRRRIIDIAKGLNPPLAVPQEAETTSVE